MKALLKFLFLFCAILVFGQTDSTSADLSLERILAFHSDISVDANGSATVTENIRVNVLGNQIKRGIFRALPLRRNLNGKNYRVKYKILSVRRNGISETYHTQKNEGFLNIYCGKEDYLLPNGIYDYEISYTAPEQIGFFSNYDEFYWNVNGVDWDFPVDKISAKVTLPSGAKISQNSCYTGAYKSSSSDCKVQILSDNQIEWSAENLSSHQNLTIAAGFQKNIITPLPPPTFFQKYAVKILLGVAFLALLSYLLFIWNKHGRDPQKPIVYPQFSPPQNLSPASLGYIFREKFNNNLLTAALVNLAVKKFVKITESESSGLIGFFKSKVFTLTKLKQPDEMLAKEEHQLMKDFFRDKNEYTLSGKYSSTVEMAVEHFREGLKSKHDKFLKVGNNSKKLLLPAVFVFVVFYLAAIISPPYSEDPEFIIYLLPLFILIPLFIWFFAGDSVKITKKNIFVALFVGAWILGVIGGMITMIMKLTAEDQFIAGFLLLSSLCIGIFFYLIKKPSPEKLETLSQIDGFKMYMGAAENERLKFHNPPEMTPEIFEKYLPYAIVLGVDKIWGEKFANVLAKSATGYTSDWYSGGTFNTMNFGSTLNSNLSSSIASASSAPSSSSSGSGGGGFSGGGGGGGGGGGW